LREDFVDESHFGRQLVLVDVEGEEAADVALKKIRVDLSVRLNPLSGWGSRDAGRFMGREDTPNPPIINTAGFCSAPVAPTPPSAGDAVGTVCPTSSVILVGLYKAESTPQLLSQFEWQSVRKLGVSVKDTVQLWIRE